MISTIDIASTTSVNDPVFSAKNEAAIRACHGNARDCAGLEHVDCFIGMGVAMITPATPIPIKPNVPGSGKSFMGAQTTAEADVMAAIETRPT